ncbi:MAG: quinone-dependent dihydroorotate dehydrogenase [Anaerolineae bacterium]
MRRLFLALADRGYAWGVRPLIFRAPAQTAHMRMMRWLALADRMPALSRMLAGVRGLLMEARPVTVGGVVLDTPLILAAGLVKGHGFADEDAALAAVARGENIMPGWRTIPALAGPVEFGSFTRWPRLGNPGTVMWRDVQTRSTQNRVGLKNPGVHAAAAFLAARRDSLPEVFGINIAVSPGVVDPDRQTEEVLAGLRAFVERGVRPAWFTLNLSCPNTEDDPGGHQTASLTEQLCGAAVGYLRTVEAQTGGAIPLWVKVGPGLDERQYQILMRVFEAVGVQAVVATNTLAMPTPEDASLAAGVGGGTLHAHAVAAARALAAAGSEAVHVVGCGGVLDGETCRDFARLGVRAVQYWSALVYRGPLAAALIAAECAQYEGAKDGTHE